MKHRAKCLSARQLYTWACVIVLLALCRPCTPCTVVRFEEQVQSKTLRWGVLTHQRADDLGYGGAYGAAAAAVAAHDGRPAQRGSSGSGEEVLHIAVIHGSEQYRSAKAFFQGGGADEAQALCVLLNEEEENRLAKIYGGGSSRPSSGGVVQTKASQRIVELLDADDVILRSPVAVEGGAEVLCYEPKDSTAGPASGAAQLPGTRQKMFTKLDSKAIVGPFSSVEEHARGVPTTVRPAIGLVLQSNLERGSSCSSNEARASTGAIVMGSVFSSERKDQVVLGPYLQLLPRTTSGFDRRILDELKCRVWVNDVLQSDFRLDTVSNDAVAAMIEIALDQHLYAGSTVLYGLPSKQDPISGLPLLPRIIQLVSGWFSFSSIALDLPITAAKGSIVKTSLFGPSHYVDLGVEANQVVPFKGRATEFTHWPSIVSHELVATGGLNGTITFASNNWLLGLLALVSLAIAVVISRVCFK